MKKILIKVEKDYISFSLTSNSNLEDFNKTNVFSGKKIKFTDTYILNNTKIVGKFINNMAEFNNVSNVVINYNEISYVVLKAIQYCPNIKKIGFKEDKTLSYVECNLLIENNHLNFVNCFSIPEYIYDRFDMLKRIKLKIRSKDLRVSNFLLDNNLHTYLDVYYQKHIIVDKELSSNDIEDFVAFLHINKYLKVIEVKLYKYDSVIDILNILKVWGRENITLLLNFDNSLFDDINKFKSLEDIYRVKIKVKDNKEYKNKRYIKNVNINMVKAILIIIFLFSLVAVGLSVFLSNKNNNKIENINKSIKEIVLEEDANDENSKDTSQDINKSNKNNVYYTDYSKMFEKLSSINNDTIGYLKVNNTKVNYPVVKYSDNDYYLTHDFNKEYNIAGWIYMDYRNNVDEIDQNTIIYGHNMLKDSLLFGSLKKTLKESWYKDSNNHIISFNTINENIKWQIFSIYTIETTNDYLITNFKSNEDFNMFIEKIQGRSIYDFNIKLNEKDKILTLSTCYKDDKHRLVIHAKKI